MQKAGIKALKNNLSAYIKSVQAGETVLVTDRGKVVARLVPADQHREPATNEEILAQLVREGRVRPAKGTWKRPPNLIGSVPFDELMRQLDADREDR